MKGDSDVLHSQTKKKINPGAKKNNGKVQISSNKSIIAENVQDEFSGQCDLVQKLDGDHFNQTNEESKAILECSEKKLSKTVQVKIEIDIMASVLFVVGLATRLYRLEEPRSIVFDELHYGKYVSLYMKGVFFFDSHPPLGKLLVAGVAYLAGFDGQFKFDRIGSAYSEQVPVFALRMVPAVCGSLLIPTVYHLMLELGLHQWTAVLAGFLLVFDNALLTQSRFVLMESMLLLFSFFGLVCIIKFTKCESVPFSLRWWSWLLLSAISLTCALCVKYVGLFTLILGLGLLARSYWKLICNRKLSGRFLVMYLFVKAVAFSACSVVVYLSVFYVHLSVLTKAGPHDSVMTSAFQASLEGGLAMITKGQPLEVAHGSQITLRHTHGRTCWLHSHAHVYPVRYPDGRGSSHQQQVTCYSFKDVNNWWIVKRPNRNDLAVSQPVDVIKHGDVIQLVHGLSSRALNSHDVAAPMSPQNQEVSCYIDYNVSMPSQNLWTVDIVNRDQVGDIWYTIQSQVRLVHVNTSQSLKFSGRQLPDWGFNQHEVVADRILSQPDTVWNVEEHRYTNSDDQKERERELVNAEMLPTQNTTLSFWDKLSELQYKMLFTHQSPLQSHMYCSEPMEWPLMSRTIAYWVSSSNAQIHLIGNVLIWWSGLAAVGLYSLLLILYLLRRRRQCEDLPPREWTRFIDVGVVLLSGYLFHFLPYFFMDRILFLHHYLPAFVFKTLLLAALIQHLFFLLTSFKGWNRATNILKVCLLVWCYAVLWVFKQFAVLTYGNTPLTAMDLIKLKWRDSWHFILQKE